MDETDARGAQVITVRVRYFAAAKVAAGLAEELREVGGAGSIDTLLGEAGLDGHPVLRRCTFLVNGVTRTDRTMPLAEGDLVDVLPPFAGG